MATAAPVRLLFVANVAWFFVSHRLPLAVAARQAGYDVHVAATVENDHEEHAIVAAGLSFHRLCGGRGRRPIWSDWRQFRDVCAVVRRTSPAIVHAVTAKPIIFAGLSARALSVPAFVGALTGLGYLYTDSSRSGLTRSVVSRALRSALRGQRSRLIVQNENDLEVMLQDGVVPRERTVLIPGSGVDVEYFRPCAEAAGRTLVVLPARMLRDKGVIEFCRAAPLVRSTVSTVRFALVGGLDASNPAALSEEELSSLCKESGVEWWGHSTDMRSVLSAAHVVCLPSYREGLPKALLEAGAMGRAIVTTDVPGCRDVVEHQVSGLLVPPGDPTALAEALSELVSSADLRMALGQAARRRVETKFSLQQVLEATLSVYDDLLKRP